MIKEERKQRFTLILFASLAVFFIIAVAIAITSLIIYILLRIGAVSSVDGLANTGTMFIIVIVCSTSIGFLITMLLGKISIKPVNQLLDRLDGLANGDYKAKFNFGPIASSIPAFKEIEDSLNATAKALENTEMLRSDFINNFSHEFKTPIVSIAGFTKLLRRGNLSEKEKQEYLEIIEEESLRLSYMANNVLNLTKVENRTVLTDASTYNLSEQLRANALLLSDKWTQKELDFDMEFDEHMISASRELLEQVWINLLDNAIKFSPRGGTITVSIAEENNCISVSISNAGKEIPEESLNRIFNKFYQADESHSSEGNGIGLAIVKAVVNLHNGRVSSESKNGITTFTVALPKSQ